MRDDVLYFVLLGSPFLLWGVGYLVADRMHKDLVMYEMCIANGMQWVEGSCVE